MPIYNNQKFIEIIRPEPINWEKDIYDIPYIEKEDLSISLIGSELFLINPKNLSKNDVDKKRKIVHSFMYDETLEKIYKDPLKYMDKISGYYATTSLDFSMHQGMSIWAIIQAVGKSRWFGRYLQSHGIKVYPTVGWVDEETYDICFAGLRDGSTFFISTLGVNNDKSRTNFFNGLFELRKRFPNSHIICVGDSLKNLPSDICIIPYEETFGGKSQLIKRNKVRLFNWDMTIPREVN
jgi:hypothetical protein